MHYTIRCCIVLYYTILYTYLNFLFYVLGRGFGDGTLDRDSIPQSQALIVGKEDFLNVMTSCIVCVMKSDVYLSGHLISWGFLHTVCQSLKRALDGERRGEPVTCIMRLLYQFAGDLRVFIVTCSAVLYSVTIALEYCTVLSYTVLYFFFYCLLPRSVLPTLLTTTSPHALRLIFISSRT